MNTAVVCVRCGSPVFSEDRFCGTCGAPRTPPPGLGAVKTSGDHAAKLLTQLKRITAGEYEVRGELGRGGMAAVYLAYDLRLNRKVAIKVMLPELAYHEGMEERFKREARTAAKLEHPNIVVIYSVRDEGELMFFVMKFIDGASLDAVIRAHAPLPIPLVRGILFQLCNALQFAHDEGVVHRDVKPANVIIDTRGNIQVTDFGIAKVTESSHLTRTGTAIGTPAYMSPEQCLGGAQSAASDQYSVGILAYELITGRTPFSGAALEIQWAHMREAPVPVIDVRPDCPETLSNAVMRMLAKDAADRWPSLRDVIPMIASGVAEAEAARGGLAKAVKSATTLPPPPFAVTPASPVPKQAESIVIDPIVVDPANGVIEIGETLQLKVRWAAEKVPVPRPADVAWTSSDSALATVSVDGLVTGLAPGPVMIAARVGTRTAACEVSVASPRPVSLEVSPRRFRLERGETQRVTCVVRDARQAPIEAAPTWSSSDPRIASVDDDGVVSGKALGNVTIAAMLDELAATATVDVVPDAIASVSLEPVTLTVEERKSARIRGRAMNARGMPIPDRIVTWSSSNRAIVTVGNDGTVTGVAPGTTTVTGTAEEMSATAQVVVVTASVAAVTIEPREVTAVVGDAVNYTASATDSLGVRLAPRAIAWRTSVAAIAKVSAQGEVITRRLGVVTITAEIDGVGASATLTVVAAPIARIDLEPRDRVTRIGKRIRLRPVAHDTRGATMPLADGAWTSSDATVATVDREGVVSAVGAGVATISVRSGDCESSTVVTVNAATPAPRRQRLMAAGAIAVALGAAAVMLVVRGINRGDDSPSSVQTPVNAPNTSAPPSSTPVNPPATLVAPPTAPPADARANSTAKAPAAPAADTIVAALRVSPDSPVAVEVGESIRLAFTATNRSGEPMPNARLQWRASDPTIASVSGTGDVTGVRPGQAAVTARAGTRTKVVEIQVRGAAPARLVASLGRDSLQVGESSIATARTFDRRGSVMAHAPSWHSSNSRVATVDDGGTVKAIGAGRATVIATAGSVSDSIQVTVVQPPPTVANQPRTNPPPSSSPESAATTPRVANPPAAPPVARAPESTAVNPNLRAPSETEARVIADSIIQMIERRQVARFTRFGQEDPAKARANLARFLERNHPSARVAGRLQVADGRSGTARITLPVMMEWRTIGGRPTRPLTVEFDVAAVPGGWSIREIGLPTGFTPND